MTGCMSLRGCGTLVLPFPCLCFLEAIVLLSCSALPRAQNKGARGHTSEVQKDGPKYNFHPFKSICSQGCKSNRAASAVSTVVTP